MSFLPDWITGFDSANADAAAEADAKLQTINAQTYGPFYQPQDSQPYGSAQQQAEIDNVFFEEATRFPRWSASAVTRYLGEIFKLIPWWVWAGACLVFFFYLGGAVLIRKQLSKL
jgi:hypothetical protein